jgi:hypothetical protein
MGVPPQTMTKYSMADEVVTLESHTTTLGNCNTSTN